MVHPLVPKWYRMIRHVAHVPKLDCTEVIHPLVPKWSCTELVLTLTIPLDRALPRFHRLSIVTVPLSVTVRPQFAMQIFEWGSDPKIYQWRPGPRLIQYYLRPHECPCQMTSHSIKRLEQGAQMWQTKGQTRLRQHLLQ